MAVTDCLTERQREVFEFIRDKIKTRGYGPTIREIGEAFGISSPNGVVSHLNAMERKKLIRRSRDKARAIEMSPEVIQEDVCLKMAGTVAAGMTNLAFEQDEWLDVGGMFSPRTHFALQVRGDSMIEAHITDGDYVVVNRRSTARPGQIVVAQNDDGEATLKYWFPEKNRVRLQPANAALAPIYLTKPTLLGVVVGVIRKFRAP